MSKFFNVTIEYTRGSILHGDPVAEQAHESRELRDLRLILTHALAGLGCAVVEIAPTSQPMVELASKLAIAVSRTALTRLPSSPINSHTEGGELAAGPDEYLLTLPGLVQPAADADMQPFPTWEASAGGHKVSGQTTDNAARLTLSEQLRPLGIEIRWTKRGKRSTSAC